MEAKIGGFRQRVTGRMKYSWRESLTLEVQVMISDCFMLKNFFSNLFYLNI